MSETLVRRYAGLSVPRYTSYPTAADFNAAIGPADHAKWLAALDPQAPVSLYLHVPYCRELCAYCGCHAKAVRKDAVVERYRALLEAEIRLVASHLPERITVGHLAWGGGTPSILGADGLGSILRELRRAFDFADGCEHAIELDPRVMDARLCEDLAALGVNRASLGVQDVDPRVQAAIGRIQPMEKVEAAVRDLRGAGIRRINFDLIYGLPNQSVESLKRTCDSVAALGPDRIACYGYAHLPQRRANQRLIDESALPSASERFDQAAIVAAAFRARGYQPIGIDHFARLCDPLAVATRKGDLHRNFQGYTDDPCRVLLGFGASAISELPGGFVQNHSAPGDYACHIGEGRLPTRRGHALTSDDLERAGVIERLMCDFRVDLGGNAAHFADELALLRPLVADGLADLRHGVLAVTEKGRPFVRLVAAVFDRFRIEKGVGFSQAV